MTASLPKFNTFAEFYPYYRSEHSDRRNEICHLVGFLFVPAGLWLAWTHWNALYILAATACVYACGWFGHFAFQKNIPATRHWPVYSFLSYFKMLFDIATKRKL